MSPSRLTVWTMACRPKTLWVAIAPVMIGSAMAGADGGFHLLSALAALFAALMIQIGTNFANDFFDYAKGSDRPDRIGPMRVTQAGWVAPSTMKRATALVFSMSILAGIYLVYRGGWPIALIGLLSILSGILYTGGPRPLGYTGLADVFVLIFFGPVAVGGTYFVQTLQINWTVVLAGLSPGLFSVAILTVNNLRDMESDSISGKRTLPVRFGLTFGRMEYLSALLIACLIPLVLIALEPGSFWPLLTLYVLPLSWPSIKTVFTSRDGKVLNDMLAATGRLLLLYALLFSLGWLL